MSEVTRPGTPKRTLRKSCGSRIGVVSICLTISQDTINPSGFHPPVTFRLKLSVFRETLIQESRVKTDEYFTHSVSLPFKTF